LLGIVSEQPDGTIAVPEVEHLRLVLALDVARELHLDNDLGSIGEAGGRDELGVAGRIRLAQFELPGDPQ
jgi:hypothetical protein